MAMSDLRLDRIIDEVAHQMTAGDPAGDLRARVLAQIATKPESRTPNHVGLWVLAPLAAAALVLVAVFVARGPQPHTDPKTAALREASPSVAPVVQPADSPHPPSPQNGFGVTVARRVVTGMPRATASDVAALAPPPLVAPSIGIDTLTTESLTIEDMQAIAPMT